MWLATIPPPAPSLAPSQGTLCIRCLGLGCLPSSLPQIVLGEVTWLPCLGLFPAVLQEPSREQGPGNEASREEWPWLVHGTQTPSSALPGQPSNTQSPVLREMPFTRPGVPAPFPWWPPDIFCCHSYLTDDKTVAQRVLVTCLSSHSLSGTEWGLGPRDLDSSLTALLGPLPLRLQAACGTQPGGARVSH